MVLLSIWLLRQFSRMPTVKKVIFGVLGLSYTSWSTVKSLSQAKQKKISSNRSNLLLFDLNAILNYKRLSETCWIQTEVNALIFKICSQHFPNIYRWKRNIGILKFREKFQIKSSMQISYSTSNLFPQRLETATKRHESTFFYRIIYGWD